MTSNLNTRRSSFNAAEVMKKSAQTVADQGERSVQPFGGDGPHVDAATTPDASAPLTSTCKKEVISTRSVQPTSPLNGRSPQCIGSGTQHAGDMGAHGKLIELSEGGDEELDFSIFLEIALPGEEPGTWQTQHCIALPSWNCIHGYCSGIHRVTWCNLVLQSCGWLLIDSG